MTERQTLIWEIDATRAVKGARAFSKAIDMAARSAEKFDRRAGSSFSKLSAKAANLSRAGSTIGKGFASGSQAIDAFSTRAQSRFLTMERSAASLRARLQQLGDTRGIRTLDAALAKLRVGMLSTAKTSGDLARSQLAFNSSIQSLRLQTATAGFAGLNTQMQTVGRTMGTLRALFGGFVGILGIRAVISAADAWTQFGNRLRTVTDTEQEFIAAQRGVVAVAVETRANLDATATLFQRLAQRTTEFGISQNQVLGVTRAVNQALQIGGASANEARSSVTQFAQALALGLRGDEFRSLSENAPRLMQVFADALNVPIKDLVKLRTEGKLTGEVLIQSLLKQAPQLAEEFKKITPTISSAFEVLRTKFAEFIGQSSDASGAGALLARTILFIADNIAVVSVAIGGLIGLGIARWAVLAAVEMATFAVRLSGITKVAGLARVALGGLGGGFNLAALGAVALRAGLIGLGIGAAILAFEALTGILSSAVGKFNELRERGFSTAEILKAAWMTTVEVFQNVSAAVVSGFQSIVQGAQATGSAIIGFFSNAWQSIVSGLNSFLGVFGTSFGGIVNAAGTAVGAVVDFFGGLAKSAIQVAKTIFNAFVTVFSGIADAAGKFFSGDFSGAFDSITSVPGKVFDEFKSGLSNLGSNFTGTSDQITGAITNGVDSVTASMRGAFDATVDFATSTANDAATNVTNIFEKNLAQIAANRPATDELATTNTRPDAPLVDPATLAANATNDKNKTRGLREQAKAARDAAAAISDFQRALELLARQEAAGRITAADAVRIRQQLNQAIANSSDPIARQNAKLAEERVLLTLSNGERAVEKRLRESRHELLKQGTDLMSAANAKMREGLETQIRANEQLKNPDSFNKFAANASKAGEGIAQLGDRIRDDLGGALADFIVDGKTSFSDMIKSWVKDLIKLSFNNTFKQLFSGGGGGLFGGGGGLFGGGGGILGGIGSIFGGLFRDGGISHAPTQTAAVQADVFRNARRFQNGGTTMNAGGGGIPAILHQNEAVIPLKNGRVPVDMGDARGGGGTNITNNVAMTVNANDARGFAEKEDHIVRKLAKRIERVQRRDLA